MISDISPSAANFEFEPLGDYRTLKMKKIDELLRVSSSISGIDNKSFRCFSSEWRSATCNIRRIANKTLDQRPVRTWLQATKDILTVLECKRLPFSSIEDLQQHGIAWLHDHLNANQRDDLDKHQEIYQRVLDILAADILRPKIAPRGLNPHSYQNIMQFGQLTPLPTLWHKHHFGGLHKKSAQLADILSRSLSDEERLHRKNALLSDCSDELKVLIERKAEDTLFQRLDLNPSVRPEGLARRCRTQTDFISACRIAETKSSNYKNIFVREAVRMQLEQHGMTGPDLLFFKTGEVSEDNTLFVPSRHMWSGADLRKIDTTAFFDELEKQREDCLGKLSHSDISPSNIRAAGMFMQFESPEAKQQFVEENLSNLLEFCRKRPHDMIQLSRYEVGSDVWEYKGELLDRSQVFLNEPHLRNRQMRLASNELFRLDPASFFITTQGFSLEIELILEYANYVKDKLICPGATGTILEVNFADAIQNASHEAICAVVETLCETVSGGQTAMYQLFNNELPSAALLLCRFLTVNASGFKNEQKSTLLKIIASIKESYRYGAATLLSQYELNRKMEALTTALGGEIETITEQDIYSQMTLPDVDLSDDERQETYGRNR